MPNETLRLEKVGEIQGRFFIPRYQRGYRWTPAEVLQLLDDIYNNGASFYCLQPVVVRSREGGEWELIDGQQRMTTLYLIYAYMHKARLKREGPLFSIRYETREDSAEYLQTLDPDRREENIDYHHLYNAYECIGNWFSAHGIRENYAADEIYRFLFDHVRVIWYEPEVVDAAELFRRLNVGRIPLTNAELIKALLLSKAQADNRAHEIAAQWDAIERDLRRPDVWSFVTEQPPEQSPTRISMLLDTLAGGEKGRMRPRFHTFNVLRDGLEEDHLQLWQRVVDLHATVMGWFDDNNLYHKVGYLVALGDQFDALWNLSRKRCKSEFSDLLDARIQDRLKLTPSALVELRYDEKPSLCADVLLLMNVESVRQIDGDGRYPFARHRQKAWSLEHIHAQNSEGLAKADQWQAWIGLHRDALLKLPTSDPTGRDELIAEIDAVDDTLTRPQFDALFRSVTARFTLNEDEGQATHGLANLALLTNDDNSALNNAVFEIKRQRVLERDRSGSYIPICTRRVFLKYYSEPLQMHFWSPQDREGYMNAIRTTVGPYLQHEEKMT